MPKVSVIIPVYNAEEYLERCLDSVCNQTLKDIEVICVDDCSTDGSLNILNEYAAKYPRMKVIEHKVNGGESKARNTALQYVSGDYLGFVDNDDYIDLDFYEKLYFKAKETNADISKGEVCIIDYDGKEVYGNLNRKIRENNSRFFFAYHWWTAIFKTEIIKRNNIKFPVGYSLGGDVLFLNEIVLSSQTISLVDDVFYHYCRRIDSGDSKILSLDKIKSVLSIHEKIIDNINNFFSSGKPDIGIAFIYNWTMTVCFNYAFRRKTIECLEFVINKTFDIYKKILNKDKLLDDLKNSFLYELEFFEENNPNGLIEFYKKYDTEKKLLMAKLRYLSKRHKL